MFEYGKREIIGFAFVFTGAIATVYATPLIAILGIRLLFAAACQHLSLEDANATTKELTSNQAIDIPTALEDLEKHQSTIANSFEMKLPYPK